MSAELIGVVKDEGPYILEWIAYHKVIGFPTITVYDCSSTDSGLELLEALHDAGEVELRNWPNVKGVSAHRAAYADAITRCRRGWVAFLGADEFLDLHRHAVVDQWLSIFPRDTSAIGINWRIFGSAGLEGYSPEPVMERFTRAASHGHHDNHRMRAFARPGNVGLAHEHYCVIKEGAYRNADGGLLEMSRNGFSNRVTHETAQINKYYLKSREEFRWKVARGNVGRPAEGIERTADYENPEDWNALDRNEELDESVCRFLPATKAEMARLSALVCSRNVRPETLSALGEVRLEHVMAAAANRSSGAPKPDTGGRGAPEDGFKLFSYSSEAGGFDYARYRSVQTEGNHRKIESQWVDEETVKYLAGFIRAMVPSVRLGICHGTRRGLEQQWFSMYLDGCDVIGTEISDTAREFPKTVQWDFHDENPEWVGRASFVYSNSWDHSYDPRKMFGVWLRQLALDGVLILEHTNQHLEITELDPFGIELAELIKLLKGLDPSRYVFERTLKDAPGVWVNGREHVRAKYVVMRRVS